MACLISTLLKKLILLLFSLLISKTQHNCELGNIGTTQAIIRNCLRGDNQFACWKEKRSSSLEGCQQHGFMEQNFAGKGLSINGNLKFTKSVCISARFRILKYLLCQHIIQNLFIQVVHAGPFFGRNRVSGQIVDLRIILQYSAQCCVFNNSSIVKHRHQI